MISYGKQLAKKYTDMLSIEDYEEHENKKFIRKWKLNNI